MADEDRNDKDRRVGNWFGRRIKNEMAQSNGSHQEGADGDEDPEGEKSGEGEESGPITESISPYTPHPDEHVGESRAIEDDELPPRPVSISARDHDSSGSTDTEEGDEDEDPEDRFRSSALASLSRAAEAARRSSEDEEGAARSSSGSRSHGSTGGTDSPFQPSDPDPHMNDALSTDHVSSELSEDDKRAIRDAIASIEQRLSFAKRLSAEDREALIRPGATGRRFVDQARELVRRRPGMLPRSFDEAEFLRDAELYEELRRIGDDLRDLAERVDDTIAAVASDAFTSALVVYQSGKMAREGGEMDDSLHGWRRKITDATKD